MTVPNYTEDLTDVTTAESVTGWAEFTGNSYNAQGSDAADTDYAFIQGTVAITQICTKDSSVGSEAYDYGAGTGGHGTDGAYFVWQLYGVNSNLGTYAQGGFRIAVGSSLADFDAWYVGGIDKAPYPYGGWTCNVINTTVSADNTAGAPTVTEQFVGSAVYVVTGSSKGSPHGIDAIRVGRGSSIFEYGESSDYCTIDGFATKNDYNDVTNGYNRWGLISKTAGGYLWQGRMQLGTASNAVDFRDADRTIFIKWTPKVTTNFNLIEVVNSSSNVEMTGFTFQVLDISTASSGRFLMTDAASVDLDTCTFIDMDTFVFNFSVNAVTINSCTFRRCGQITQAGATFTDCIFEKSSSSSTIISNDISKISGCSFTSDGSNYSVNLGTISASESITWGNYLSGYASTNGITGNEAIYCSVASGQTLTINVTSGYDTPSVHNAGTGTINVVNAVIINVYVKDTSNNVIEGASVAVYKSSDSTELMNELSATTTGLATESFAYVVDTDVYIRVRKSSTGTRYTPVKTTGTISSNGLTLTVVLNKDSIVT